MGDCGLLLEIMVRVHGLMTSSLCFCVVISSESFGGTGLSGWVLVGTPVGLGIHVHELKSER